MVEPYLQVVHEEACLVDPWDHLVPSVDRGQGAHVEGHSWDQMVACPQSVVAGDLVVLVPSSQGDLAFLEEAVPSCQVAGGL